MNYIIKYCIIILFIKSVCILLCTQDFKIVNVKVHHQRGQ